MITDLAREHLPPRIKTIVRPVHSYLTHVYFKISKLRGNNYVRYNFNGEDIDLYYTNETRIEILNILDGDKVTLEGVPTRILSTDEEVETVIDVGGHYGYYSLLLKKLNPDVDVHVFEPDEYNRKVLTRLLDENEISCNVRSEVVAGNSGKITFYVHEDNGSQSHSVKNSASTVPVTKDCISIADVISGFESEGVFLKIDAEGGEYEILTDLMAVSGTYVEAIVEIHPEKLDVPVSEVLALLKDNCDEMEFLGDTSPDHPRTKSIEGQYNRPMYHIVVKT